MNWSTFLQTVADRSGVSLKTTRTVLSTAVAVAQEQLVAGNAVSLWGLGTLSSRWQKARVIRDIKTQRKMFLDGRHAAHFRPASALQRALVERSPQRWQSDDHQLAWRLSEALIGDLAAYHFAQAPRDLTPQTPAAAVHQTCQQAFGDVWTNITETFAARIPADVRAESDHLASAVLRRWASPPAP